MITSVENIEERFSLYPNPTDGVVNISSDENIQSVLVYDVQGRLVANFRGKSTIDISHLSTGIYALHVDGQVLKVAVK